VAQLGGPTATPLPYNAVIAEYVVATVTPENVATAAVMVREATAAAAVAGTATPTPWEWAVITPTPLPTEVPPTPTPTLPPLILERDFTPTPTLPPSEVEVAPSSLPPEFRNKIVFRTNRTGSEEVFLIDPATGDAGKVTRSWVYPLAQEQLAVSPDGTKLAVVKADNNGVLQIFSRSLEYGTDTQLTTFGNDSYDPAWSPSGEWIVFVGTNTGNDEIYRVSPDGQTVQQLTFNSFEWDKHPTWSPDGSQILFFSNRETGRRQLWIMNVDGGGQRNYSSNEYEDWNPIWTR
jgi:dipeptidyl aminopeptidase/acylaminoacyl peptidase